MLDPKSWLDKAQALPEGTKRRTSHDCGDGTPLLIECKPDGWSAWCHRCDDKGWVSRQLSLSEKLARITAANASDEATRHVQGLPIPRVSTPRDWPLEARVWLYKAGFSNADIETLGVYWHAPTQRVVLPLYDSHGQLVYWQARDPFWKRGAPRPKYLNPAVNKARLVAKYGSGPCIVLTEDILSAYKVGKTTEAWSLMGTALKTWIIHELIEAHRPVITWLDPDDAGQTAASAIRRGLRSYGLDVHNLVTPKDPKLHWRSEIESYLKEYL
ncbi:toprim domain-containing protein [Escherichia coli]|uniref:toprim domain-containing protein n=1 Tax=Escherichia coli TaxID=562 RepID=UPI00307A3B62